MVLWIWLQALVTSCPPLLGWSTVSYMAPMYRLVWVRFPLGSNILTMYDLKMYGM